MNYAAVNLRSTYCIVLLLVKVSVDVRVIGANQEKVKPGNEKVTKV